MTKFKRKFKVGDIVQVLNSIPPASFCTGKIGKVTEVDDSRAPYQVHFIAGGRYLGSYWYREGTLKSVPLLKQILYGYTK